MPYRSFGALRSNHGQTQSDLKTLENSNRRQQRKRRETTSVSGHGLSDELSSVRVHCSLSDISLAEADRRRFFRGLSRHSWFRQKHSTELTSMPSVSSVTSCSNIRGFIPSGRSGRFCEPS